MPFLFGQTAATSTPKISNYPAQSEGDRSIRVVQWYLTTADPTGVPISMAEWDDKTVEVDFTTNDADYGALALGGSQLAIEGSNNGVYGTSFQNKIPLNRAAGGTALSALAANICQSIIENPLYMAPRLTTVGAGAKVLVTLVLKRNAPTPRA
jgi:hypothetical protein